MHEISWLLPIDETPNNLPCILIHDERTLYICLFNSYSANHVNIQTHVVLLRYSLSF